jgi:hypothetical protein
MKPSLFAPIQGLVLLALVTTACSPKPADPAAPAASKAASAPTSSASASTPVGNSSPECSTLERLDPPVGPSVTTSCTIKLSGLDEGSSFKVDLVSGVVSEIGQPGETAKVSITKMVGTEGGQVIEEEGVTLLVPPEYRDINGDGERDFLIARDIGNVNATSAVWMGDPEGAPFVRAGEVAGSVEAPTKDGLLPVANRGSADTTGFEFYKYSETQLKLVGSVLVTAVETSADGNVTKTSCTLDDTSGLAAAGLNAAAAKAKFCAEPVVVNAYK